MKAEFPVAKKFFELEVKGLASKKSWIFCPKPLEEALTVLEYLRRKEIPLASSCLGEGVCQLCVVNKKLLTCQFLVKDLVFLSRAAGQNVFTLEVDYL